MEQDALTRIALLEQAQVYHKEVIDKILDLAETTRDLMVEQARRVDAQDAKATNIAIDLKEHSDDDLKFHNEVRDSLDKFVKEQKEFNDKLREDFEKITKELEKRISWLEKWWWKMTGALMVLGIGLKMAWDYIVNKK